MLVIGEWPDKWIEVECSATGKKLLVKAVLDPHKPGRLVFIFCDDDRNFEIERTVRKRNRTVKPVETETTDG